MLTPELLSAVAAIVFSLIFSYVPGVKDMFGALTRGQKQMIMGVVITAIAGAVFGLSCVGAVHYVTCDQIGLIKLLNCWVSAMVANQSIYRLTKQ